MTKSDAGYRHSRDYSEKNTSLNHLVEAIRAPSIQRTHGSLEGDDSSYGELTAMPTGMPAFSLMTLTAVPPAGYFQIPTI